MEAIWDFIKSLVIPDYSDKNCPHIYPPDAGTFLRELTSTQLVLLIVGSVLTLSVISIGSIHAYYIHKFVSSGKRRSILYFLASLLPISCFMATVGMYLPRTAMILSSFCVEYFLLSLFNIVSLLRHLSGGRACLADSLQRDMQLISYRSPPICCCLSCLPKSLPTEKNIRRLELAVVQAPIVRGLIVFGQIIAVTEARDHSLIWFQLFELSSMVSLMVAIFAIHTLVKLVSESLSKSGLIKIFRTIDVALMLFTVQHPLLFQNIFLRFGVIHCEAFLPPEDNARFICNFVTIAELFFLIIVSTFLMGRKREKLLVLDLYSEEVNRNADRSTLANSIDM